MKNVFVALLLALGISSSAHATVIACMKQMPTNWYDTNDGKKSATISGPGLIVDVLNKQVVWVATGSYLTVDALYDQQGLAILKLSGSNPVKEQIVKLDTDKTSYSVVHTIKLQDSLGGFGYLTVSLQTVSSKSYMTGTASWSDQSGSRENLTYCTTYVRP